MSFKCCHGYKITATLTLVSLFNRGTSTDTETAAVLQATHTGAAELIHWQQFPPQDLWCLYVGDYYQHLFETLHLMPRERGEGAQLVASLTQTHNTHTTHTHTHTHTYTHTTHTHTTTTIHKQGTWCWLQQQHVVHSVSEVSAQHYYAQRSNELEQIYTASP